MNTRNANTTNLTAAQTELPQNQFKLEVQVLVGSLCSVCPQLVLMSLLLPELSWHRRPALMAVLGFLCSPSCDDPDPPLSQSRQRNDENTTAARRGWWSPAVPQEKRPKGERIGHKHKVRWFDYIVVDVEVIVRCTSWFLVSGGCGWWRRDSTGQSVPWSL
jgi:hypothetical protein